MTEPTAEAEQAERLVEAMREHLVACVEGWTHGDDVSGPMQRARAFISELASDPPAARLGAELAVLRALETKAKAIVPFERRDVVLKWLERWQEFKDALAAVEQARQL